MVGTGAGVDETSIDGTGVSTGINNHFPKQIRTVRTSEMQIKIRLTRVLKT